MSASDPSNRQEQVKKPDTGGRLAAFIYLAASGVAAVVFWLVTTFTGVYPAAARYGGAIWVFILMTIVLMPIVIPRVARWRQGRAPREGECAL